MKLALGLLIIPTLLAGCAGTPVSTGDNPEGATGNAAAYGGNRFATSPKKVQQSKAAQKGLAPWAAAAQSNAVLPSASTEAASKKYPAFAPDAPQVVNNGGKVLAHEKIVTLTWNDDPLAADLESFGDTLGTSPEWGSLSEYGVGASISGPSRHVRGHGLGATITDTQLIAMIKTNVADTAASHWPANDPETVYAVYLPSSTQFLVDNGDGTTTPFCHIAGAYHDEINLPAPDGGVAPLPILFAVMPRCYGDTLDYVTLDASHEFGEAATDPHVGWPYTNYAYVGFDQNHLAYDMFQYFQDETGDACEFFAASSWEEPTPNDFYVQRLWSNKSAASGHNPCLPLISGEAYYNTTTFANQMQTITVDFAAAYPAGSCTAASPCTQTTQGIKVGLGQSASFDLGFYSDAPTANWTVQAVSIGSLPFVDANNNPLSNGQVDIKIENPTGNNGHKAHVTVTPRVAGALGAELIEFVAGYTEFNEARTVAVLVGQK